MTRRYYPIVLYTFSIVVIFLLLGQHKKSETLFVPYPVLSNLEAGDIVFRGGTAIISDTVNAFDNREYSHVGLLIGNPEHWQVIHSIPAERVDRINGVVIDDLSFFLDKQRAQSAGFYRVMINASLRAKAVQTANSRVGNSFGLRGQETYCTKFIYQAYWDAGIDLKVRFKHIELPLIPGYFLLPSGLLSSPYLKKIYETTDMRLSDNG